ncbi:MAG: undecaprenyl-phosphate alpha-N-acetylglucosaminyl 1-phosphate transferase [Gammaproteobacteria bacterium]|nr:MAG: undecaprenyl-phosphate alpha-N-acetylglucosaminyl 1-phosphate transferase [Gammaproteobacteria bacterium]
MIDISDFGLGNSFQQRKGVSNMGLDITLIITSFISTIVLLWLLKPIASNIGLIDSPGGRKRHQGDIPLIGGLGIFFSTVIFTLNSSSSFEYYLPLVTISGLLLLVGAIDDAKNLPVKHRLSIQIFAGFLMIIFGNNKLTSFGDILFLGDIDLGFLSIPLTLIAVCGCINAHNMTDGADGLSGGLTLITLSSLGILAYINKMDPPLSFIIILSCTVAAFLQLNFRFPWNKRASVFLGDSGSMMLGFIIAWFLISFTQGETQIIRPAIALWIFAVPLLDIFSTMIRRIKRGASPFTPGRDHIHHILIDQGLSVRKSVVAIYTIATACAFIGIVGHIYNLNESLMFLAFALLFVAYFAATSIYAPGET